LSAGDRFPDDGGADGTEVTSSTIKKNTPTRSRAVALFSCLVFQSKLLLVPTSATWYDDAMRASI